MNERQPFLPAAVVRAASLGILALAILAAPAGARSHGHPKASASAEPSAEPSVEPTAAPYATFDGTWEVQAQNGHLTTYSHFILAQQGDRIGGRWLQGTGKEVTPTPITGTLENERFSFSGKTAVGPFTMAGYSENASSMIGIITQNGVRTAFTASHQGSPFNARGAKHTRRGERNTSTKPPVTVLNPAPAALPTGPAAPGPQVGAPAAVPTP